MNKAFTEDTDFKGIDYRVSFLAKGEYEACRFINCNFSKSDLSHLKFISCEFEDCDLSLVNIMDTTFGEVKFKNCKLLGLHFENCNEFLFSVGFESCQLNLSSFFKLKLKNTIFIHCSLKETDFVESDLSNVVFANCDLSGAVFERTILEKADFRTSFNYIIDPELNRVKKAKFSLSGLGGLLNKYNIVIE